MDVYYNLSNTYKNRKIISMPNIIKHGAAAASFLAFLSLSVPAISASNLTHSAYSAYSNMHVVSISIRKHNLQYSNIKRYHRNESLKSEFNNDLKAFARIVSENISNPSTCNSEQLKAIEKKLSCDVIKMDHILPNSPSLSLVKKLRKPKTHMQSSTTFSMRSFFKRPDVRKLIGNFNF